jgi:hypothetical protein
MSLGELIKEKPKGVDYELEKLMEWSCYTP